MTQLAGAGITLLTQEQIDKLEGQQLDLDFETMITTGAAAEPTLTVSDIDTITSIDWNSLHNDTISLGPVWSDTLSVNPSSKITLTGDDADIEINGESVVSMLREIRDRLNIIQVSETMEAEWDELRALREQYEAKLAECREKSQAWSALKQMPPPPKI